MFRFIVFEFGFEVAAGNFTWGAQLIKCIDPNEGEALRRGGGLGASLPELGGGD